jgi:hypothetical protein
MTYRPNGDEIRAYMQQMDVGLLEAKRQLTIIKRRDALNDLRHLRAADDKAHDRLDALLDILLEDIKCGYSGK